jgi:cytochrome oxidase Cu insertion factor (SCO1/SenC/PrrC family)
VRPTTRWALLAAVPLLAIAAVSLAFVLRASPAASGSASTDTRITWAPGQQRAPVAAVRTPGGHRFTTAALRGAPFVLTFVDPHCTTFCPRESLVIDDALRTLPPQERPTVLAVSVDPTVTSPRVFAREARRFKWSSSWQWATGTRAELRKVWRSFHVTVIPTKRDITHTEVAYVIDGEGFERVLLLWPFRKGQLLRALAAAAS